ncbi:MAG: winged helix-turn-helix domain-containing protein [Thermoplasmata archaeon]|nr:winged helix-turn-helix domain-containing protein [Thermoplasmata archaeon]
MFRESINPFKGAAEMRVELDKKSLFALASDTRLDILRSLQPMRRTVTQLSESLGIDKAAIHRHLKKLEEGGLVKRYEDHGFVYYGLSWKARDLLSPNDNTRVIVLLSSSWIFMLIAFFLVFAAINSYGFITSGLSPTMSGEQDAFSNDRGIYSVPWLIWPMVISALVIISVTLIFLARRSLIKPKQKQASESASNANRPL